MGDLTEFVAKLESSDETERIYAAEDIGYLNASEGVAPFRHGWTRSHRARCVTPSFRP